MVRPGLYPCFVLAVLTLSACTVFEPYPYPPPQSVYQGTFDTSVTYLRQAEVDLQKKVKSVDSIRSVTGLTTFAGFGGAALAAVARASNNTILGFSGLGATSITTNGLYGSVIQSKIYNSGLAALGCVDLAISPVAAGHTGLVNVNDRLNSELRQVSQDRALVSQDRIAKGTTVSQRQFSDADTKSTAAIKAIGDISSRFAQDDRYSGKIVSVVNGIIQSVYSQLLTNLPDAAALARAGTSLGTAMTNVGTENPNTQLQPHGLLAPQIDGAEDAKLGQDLVVLAADTAKANALLTAAAQYPQINCTVDTVTVSPISIPGAVNSAVTITAGSKANYSISGGTPPYTKAEWEGDNVTQAQIIGVTLLSPGTLVLDATKAKAGGPYLLRLFDSGNSTNAMANALKVTVQTAGAGSGGAQSEVQDAGAAKVISVSGAGNGTLTLGQNESKVLTLTGGSGTYLFAFPDGSPLIAKIAANKLTLNGANAPAGTYTFTVSDKNDQAVKTTITVTVKKAELTILGNILLAQGQTTTPIAIKGGTGSYSVTVDDKTDAPVAVDVIGSNFALTPALDAPIGSHTLTIKDTKNISIGPLTKQEPIAQAPALALALKDSKGKSASNRLKIVVGTSAAYTIDGGSGAFTVNAVGLGTNPKPTAKDATLTVSAGSTAGSSYFVTVTDNKDKTKSLTLIVEVPK